MKKLFSVLFILFGLSASAQVYVTQDNANQFRLFGGYGQFTQGFRLPIQGKTAYTATDSTGFIRYNDSDSSVKYFTGFQWITLPKTSGGGSFDTTTIYQNLALKENLSNKTTSAVGTSNFLYPTQGAVYAQDLLRVLYTDTAAMFSGYVRIGRFNDSLAAHRTLIDSKLSTATAASTYVPYTGATTNVNLGTYNLTTDAVQFNTTPSVTPAVGLTYWDAANNTIATDLDVTNGVTMQIGQENYIRVVNKTGVTITDGQVVYVSGAQGNRPTVILAQSDSIHSSEVVGVATQNIANNAEGFVTTVGVVNGFNTSTYTAGDQLYLSTTTAGVLTATVPASPDNVTAVAIALNSTVNGAIYVHPQKSVSADSNFTMNTNRISPSILAVKAGLRKKVDYTDTAAMLANYLHKADTTGRFVTSVVKRNDSFFYVRNGTYTYFGRDSTGGGSAGVTYLWSAKLKDHFEAGKITGVSDGAALNTWTNTGSGTLSNLTFDGTAPTYFTNYRGMPAVRFTRASSTSMTFTSQAFKQVVVVCNNVDGATFADYEGLMGNPVSGADWLWYADAASGTGMTQAGGDRLMTQAFETSTNTFAPLSQSKITTFVSSAGISSRTTRVGAFWNLAGRYWNGYIQEMLFFSDVLTQEEYIALHQYLTAKYAVYKPVQVFVDGNSLFSGGYTGVTALQSAGAEIKKKADTVTSSYVYFYNASVGGTVTDQNTFNAQTVTGINYRMNYQPLFARQIDIIYSYTNQGFGGSAASAYITDLNEYIDVVTAANPNLEVWVPTPLSCDTSIYSEPQRQLVLTYLRNHKNTKNFKVANITNPIFDATGAYADPAVFVDGIHIALAYVPLWADEIIKQVFHYYAQE